MARTVRVCETKLPDKIVAKTFVYADEFVSEFWQGHRMLWYSSAPALMFGGVPVEESLEYFHKENIRWFLEDNYDNNGD